MSNSKKVASIAFTGAAATAATVMGATPALAASHTWHIKNNGAGYHGPFKAKNKGNTTLVDKHGTTTTTLTCKKAFASGSIPNSNVASTAPMTKLGTVKAAGTHWSSCSVAGFHFIAKLLKNANLSATNYASGVTTGKLTGSLSGSITGINGNTCKGKVTGTSVPVKYHNAGHSLVVNSGHLFTLNVKSVTGLCFGALNNGDTAYFAGTYSVTSPTGLTISRT